MSRFLARASNSKFSHTGIVAIEVEGPVVYDIDAIGVSRQPFCVWILDNIGSIGVKRLRPEYQRRDPQGCGVLSQGIRGASSVRLPALRGRYGTLLHRDDRKSLSFRGYRAVTARSAWEIWSAHRSFPSKCSVSGLRPSMRWNIR